MSTAQLSSPDAQVSPEQLDRLIQVVTPRAWVPLGALAMMAALGLVWSVTARLPIYVSGRGAFVDPAVAFGAKAHVVSVEAPGTGVLKDLLLVRGGAVTAGQVIGHLDQPELRKQLELDRAKLAELQHEGSALGSVEGQRDTLSQQAIDQERKAIARRIAKDRAIEPQLRARVSTSLKAQRARLVQELDDARPLLADCKTALARQLASHKPSVSTPGDVAAREAYLNALEQISGLESQLRDLDAKRFEFRQALRDNEKELAQLTDQAANLDIRGRSVALDSLQAQVGRAGQLDELRRQIVQREAEYAEETEIVAPVSGRVLEVDAVLGQRTGPGNRLGSIEAAENEKRPLADRLIGVAYFTIGDGKHITPGMAVEVTPDSVWREEYGGILGKVISVSDFPVTRSGVLNVVSSEDTASALLEGGHTIEVFFALEADPQNPNYLHWSSKRGAKVTVSAGTTSEARVTVARRAPITYLLPALKDWAGLK